MIKTSIQVYDKLKHKVQFLYTKLKLYRREKKTGRTLAISPVDSVSLALFKQRQNIATKKSVFEMFQDTIFCTYKTFVVSLNRFAKYAMIMLGLPACVESEACGSSREAYGRNRHPCLLCPQSNTT